MFSEFLSMLDFAFGVTGPIFLTVSLGIFLKRVNVIDTVLMDKASKLVFMVALPALLFMSVVKTDLSKVLNPELLLVSVGATIAVFILLSMVAPILVTNARDRGVFVQGAFRGNLAIVGLALCINAYGDAGLASASILMSILTLFYNVLSIYTLSASLDAGGQSVRKIGVSILKNPLIIAIVSGMVINVLRIPIPAVAMKTGGYLAQMTLPLALLCIGGSLSFSEMRSSSWVAMWSVAAKLVITPIFILLIVYWYGFRGMDLGVVFLMVSTPSAAVSYIMVQAMGGNAKLAANIVVVSTLLSLVTVSLGLVILKAWGVI